MMVYKFIFPQSSERFLCATRYSGAVYLNPVIPLRYCTCSCFAD